MALRDRLMAAIAAASFVQLANPPDAAAYIDPATGSLLLQAILGGFAGVLVIVKLYYRKLLTRFGRRPRDEDTRSAGGTSRPQ